MTWGQLHDALRASGVVRTDVTAPKAGVKITGVAYDSRRVEPGNVFVALKGQHADGSAFVRQALERGAAVIVAEQAAPDQIEAPWAIVDDARLALARLASTFFDHPSAEMRVVGITGTNGKTTTAYLITSIFEAAGIKCGMLGTVAYRIGTSSARRRGRHPKRLMQRLMREWSIADARLRDRCRLRWPSGASTR